MPSPDTNFGDFGLREQRTGRRETASGPGSSRTAAKQRRILIDTVVRRYSTEVSFGPWLRRLELDAGGCSAKVGGGSYAGWEAHPTLVKSLAAEYGDERTLFRVSYSLS